jgi:phage pi2 protein 07
MKGGIKLLNNQQEVNKVWWNMKDLEEATGYKEDWLKENILLQPRFKNFLDLDNGGFVYYPEKRGQKWLFIASRMQEFLEKHFVKIFGKSS